MPTAGGRLVVAASQEPDCWDSQISAADATSRIVRSVVDSLVGQLPTGELMPWLADSWTVIEDVTTYTFVLHDGVTFSDGTPFDAEAVKFDLDWVANPKTGSQYA
ncbi:MAG: ABC transporter substrate-binding protein, partial [Thermomicrobiales bacterium]